MCVYACNHVTNFTKLLLSIILIIAKLKAIERISSGYTKGKKNLILTVKIYHFSKINNIDILECVLEYTLYVNANLTKVRPLFTL